MAADTVVTSSEITAYFVDPVPAGYEYTDYHYRQDDPGVNPTHSTRVAGSPSGSIHAVISGFSEGFTAGSRIVLWETGYYAHDRPPNDYEQYISKLVIKGTGTKPTAP